MHTIRGLAGCYNSIWSLLTYAENQMKDQGRTCGMSIWVNESQYLLVDIVLWSEYQCHPPPLASRCTGVLLGANRSWAYNNRKYGTEKHKVILVKWERNSRCCWLILIDAYLRWVSISIKEIGDVINSNSFQSRHPFSLHLRHLRTYWDWGRWRERVNFKSRSTTWDYILWSEIMHVVILPIVFILQTIVPVEYRVSWPSLANNLAGVSTVFQQQVVLAGQGSGFAAVKWFFSIM